MALLGADDLYETARSGGISHGTAKQAATLPRIGRGPLSGHWPPMPSDLPGPDTGYDGPAPTVDSFLWLKKVGMALYSPPIVRYLVTQRLPMVVNCRARGAGGWRDGKISLDLKLRHHAGELGVARVEYKSVRIPIQACLEHDTRHVLGKVLADITQRSVSVIEQTILNETDLRHVSG